MTTWVLLRGLGREARHWGAFAGDLQAALGPAVNVLPVDLPGMGTARARPSPWTVGGIVADVLGRVQALRASPPYVWVGMSLGGMVAIGAADRWASRTAGCAVINSSAASLSPPWHRLRPPAAMRLLAAAMLPRRLAAARERQILRLTANRPVPPHVRERWEALAREAPPARRDVLAQLWAAAWNPSLPALRCPAIVVASAGDRIVSPGCSHALARHWGVPLNVHPTAGHDLVLDEPGWLISRLLDFAQAMDVAKRGFT